MTETSLLWRLLVPIVIAALVFTLSWILVVVNSRSQGRREQQHSDREYLRTIYQSSIFALSAAIASESADRDRPEKVQAVLSWLSVLLVYHPKRRGKDYEAFKQKLNLVDAQRQKRFFEELKEMVLELAIADSRLK